LQHIILYAHVHAYSPSYSDDYTDFAVVSETVCLWLIDLSYDCAIDSLLEYYSNNLNRFIFCNIYLFSVSYCNIIDLFSVSFQRLVVIPA